jgi:hypothetical protein
MKTILTWAFAFAALIGSSASASAACDNIQTILDNAYPSAGKAATGIEIDGGYKQSIDPGVVACQIWSSRPDLTLLAIPRLEAHPAADDETRGDIEVIVAETKSGQIVARHLEKGAAFSDAIAFGSVDLDTGRYDIKPGLRAFGFRARYSHNSSAFPFNETVLWLYALEDKRIVPVLEGLTVETGRGENDQNCTGHFDTTLSTVTMGKADSAGYRTLVIDQSTRIETTRPGTEDCSSVTKDAGHKRYVLRYGAPHYGAFDGKGNFKDASYADLFSPLLSDR